LAKDQNNGRKLTLKDNRKSA